MYKNSNVTAQSKHNYELYQKESQTVSVRSTDTRFFVSLPQLQPVFQNQSLNIEQNIAYQLRSFQFTNNFDNIEVGDKIMLRISLGWKQISANPLTAGSAINIQNVDYMYTDIESVETATVYTVPNTVLEINLSQSYSSAINDLITPTNVGIFIPRQYVKKQLSAPEIVEYLNARILEMAYKLYMEQTIDKPTRAEMDIFSVSEQNLIYFAGACQFYYDNASGKLGVRYDVSYPVMHYCRFASTAEVSAELQGAVPDLQQYMMTFVNVEIASSSNNNSTTQERIGRYLGLESSTGVTLSEFETCDYYGSVLFGDETFAQMLLERYITIGVDQQIDYTFGNVFHAYMNNLSVAAEGFHAQNNFILQRTFRNIMNVHRHQLLYIHTSLNTNFWSQHGLKSDIMDIIPLTKSMAELGEYHNHETRLYEIKDPNINTFTISFLNEFHEEVVFKDKYLFNLAIFFAAPV